MSFERGLLVMKKQINDTFLKAARGEQTEHVPVWFMSESVCSNVATRINKSILYLKLHINLSYVHMLPDYLLSNMG